MHQAADDCLQRSPLDDCPALTNAQPGSLEPAAFESAQSSMRLFVPARQLHSDSKQQSSLCSPGPASAVRRDSNELQPSQGSVVRPVGAPPSSSRLAVAQSVGDQVCSGCVPSSQPPPARRPPARPPPPPPPAPTRPPPPPLPSSLAVQSVCIKRCS